jgi:hypothetical protein
MNRNIIQLAICIIIVIHLGNILNLNAQRPPDSLFQSVVIFKRPAYGNAVDSAMKAYYREAKLPQATGFYIRPDSAGQLYIVTANHSFHRNDSSETITIQWKTLLDKHSFTTSHTFRVQGLGLYPQDTLIDIVLVSESRPPEFVRNVFNNVHAFHPNEIMTKEEFLSIKSGQEMFYIGMYPNSIASIEDYYWSPTGQLKEIYSIPRITKDTMANFTFCYDFKLNIVGKGGISGSPIIMKVDDSYKVFGIINGYLNDSSQTKQTKNFIGTAGYRILEILRIHSLW